MSRAHVLGEEGEGTKNQIATNVPPLPVWEKFPASIADFFWPKKHRGRGGGDKP